MKKPENLDGITKYELRIEGKSTVLRFYASNPDYVRGFCNIELIPTATPKASTLKLLRQRGAKQAELFGVPFIDLTA